MSRSGVKVNNLQYTYPDGTKALQGISFEINPGESVGIVGANGAGKSTLLSHLIGVVISREGNVRVGELEVNSKTLVQIRKTVGMIFQDSDDQLFMPTVWDDVAFGPINLGLSKAETAKRVSASLETVGALQLKDRPPYKLSGGEKRLVAIASVLAMEPDVLVMDEPSSALDPMARRRLINLLRTFGHTKIIATHDLDMVFDLCERTIVLSEGKIVADGLTAEIFQDEQLLSRSHLEKPLQLQGCPICNPKRL